MRARTAAAALTAAFALLAIAAPPGAGFARALEALVAADRRGDPWPLVSVLVPDLDVAGAYRLQSAFALERLAGREPAGFKAGLWDPKLQRRFGLDGPFFGVLDPRGRMASGEALLVARYPGLMLEIEIGFVLDCGFDAPLADAGALDGCIRERVPVLELPRARFAVDAPRGVDIIAVNTGAELFVAGAPFAADVDVDALAVRASRDGEPLAEVRGDALGVPQREALRWLVNAALAHGWAVEPGRIYLTGALAAPLPARPGHYRVRYGESAEIDLLLL